MTINQPKIIRTIVKIHLILAFAITVAAVTHGWTDNVSLVTMFITNHLRDKSKADFIFLLIAYFNAFLVFICFLMSATDDLMYIPSNRAMLSVTLLSKYLPLVLLYLFTGSWGEASLLIVSTFLTGKFVFQALLLFFVCIPIVRRRFLPHYNRNPTLSILLGTLTYLYALFLFGVFGHLLSCIHKDLLYTVFLLAPPVISIVYNSFHFHMLTYPLTRDELNQKISELLPTLTSSNSK